MDINWDLIPWHAAAGGLVIGSAVALLMLFNGRIAGISGIVGGLYRMQKGDISWRITFIVGLMLSAIIWQLFFVLPEIQIKTSGAMLACAGLLVGFGTRLGSGCTSGHGVCGLARFSPRSAVATGVFMTTGFITVYVIRHLLNS